MESCTPKRALKCAEIVYNSTQIVKQPLSVLMRVQSRSPGFQMFRTRDHSVRSGGSPQSEVAEGAKEEDEMRRERSILRAAVALVATVTMVAGLVPAPAVAEAVEEASGVGDVAQVEADEEVIDSVSTSPEAVDEVVGPVSEEIVDSAGPVQEALPEGDSSSEGCDAGETVVTEQDGADVRGSIPGGQAAQSDVGSVSDDAKDRVTALVERAAQEVREAVPIRSDLSGVDEQAKFVATLFDACVASLSWGGSALEVADAEKAAEFYCELADVDEEAGTVQFGVLRELLAKDVTEEGAVSTFAGVLRALGIECVEVEGADGACWVMACVSEAWYHADPVAAVKAVAADGDSNARDIAHSWLLVSDGSLRAADPVRAAWTAVDGFEPPLAAEGFAWDPENGAEFEGTREDEKDAGEDSSRSEEPEAQEEGEVRSSNDSPEGTIDPAEDVGRPLASDPALDEALEGPQARGEDEGPSLVERVMAVSPVVSPAASALGEEAPTVLVQSDSSVTFDELNGWDMCLEQPRRGDCVVTSCAMMLRRAERLLGWDGWSSVDVASIRADATGSSSGQSVKWDWWHDDIRVQVSNSGIKNCSETTKAETLKAELDSHPEGVVLYGESGQSTHAVLATDYEGDTFYCIDPNPGNATERMPLTSCYLVRLSTAYQIWHITNLDIPRWDHTVPIPDWSKYGGDANLPSGYYSIRPVLDTRKYLEIGGGGTGDGDNVQIWTHSWPGECDHIRWHLNRLEDGSYGVDTFAGKVLDVSGGSQDDGANAQQWSWTGVNQQHWYIHDCGNGTYALEAKHSGKFLDLTGGGTGDGTNVQQYGFISNDNPSQKWVITPCELYGGKRDVDDGWWYIRAAADPNYTLDISCAATGNGENLQIWSWDRVPQQQFRFIKSDNDETYRIEARHSGRVLDVASGSRFQGANIGQWEYGGVDQQRWWVQDVGDWKVAFQSKNSGLYIDIAGGVCQNGQNVHQWSKGEGDAAKWWYLTPAHEGTVTNIPDGTYEIVTSIDNASVVAATPSEDDDYAAMAASNDSLRQRFSLTNSSDGSVRVKNLGNDSYLDVRGASLAKGTLNNFWSDTDTPQQHWYVEDAGSGTYSFRNKWTNWYLDVKDGSTAEGTHLQMWEGNSSDAQKFKLRRLTLADATIDAIASQAYTGSAVTPDPTVRFAGRVLTKGTDYTVSYTSNVAAGTATVTVTGANGFEGSKSATFDIATVTLSSAALSAIPDQLYTGSASMPEPIVTLGGRTLVRGDDYTLSWSNNVDAGTATVTATGRGSYTGSKSATFKIVAATTEPVVFVSPDRYTYDGSKKSPLITVTASSKTLTEGTDYDLSYTGDFTNVGTHTVKATLKGNYSGTAQANVQIAAADVSAATISSISDKTYTGSQIKPDPNVTFGDKTLAKNTDYTVTWTNNTNVGTATVTVAGKGNYTGTKSATFKIVSKAISPTVTLSKTSLTYNGSAQRPTLTVEDGSTTLAESQYSVTWPSGCTNVGSYSVKVTLKGNYSGSATESFSIVAADLASATISTIASQTYNGTAIQPSPSVVLGGKTLVKGTDYTLTWSDNTNAGTATVVATGEGNYTGSNNTTFSIARAKIAIPATSSCTYNGKTQVGVAEGAGYSVTGTTRAISAGTYSALATPDDNHTWLDGTTDAKSLSWTIARKKVSVRANNITKVVGENDPQLTARVLGTVGSESVTYQLDRERGDNVGSYEILATGDAVQGNYEVSFQGAIFTIAQGLLDDATIEGLPAEIEYDGTEKKPAPTVRLGGRLLSSETDYVVSYYDNIELGTASIVVAGIGDYSGATSASFRIVQRKVTPTILLSDNEFEYTGEVQRPQVVVKDGASTLADSQYDISWPDGCVEVGSYTIVVKLKGKVQGTASKVFRIVSADLSKCTIGGVTNQAYKGTEITPMPVVRLNGRELKRGEDFYVVYDNNVDAGSASMTVCGMGNYTGTSSCSFRIVPTSLAGADVSGVVARAYTGRAQVQAPVVVVGGRKLSPTTDYTISYERNVGAGTASMTLAGRGNYSDSKTVEFEIVKAASSVSLSAQSKTYTGKAIAYSGKVTRSGSTGAVTYAYFSDAACAKAISAAAVKAAGTYYVRATLAADANHKAATSAAAKLTVAKAAQPMKLKAVKRTAKAAKVKKKAVTVAAPLKFTKKAQGKVTYAKVAKGSAKCLTVNKKTGKVTVKQGTKKGTYKVKIKVTAKGNKNYKAGSETVTCTVVVK